MDPHTKPIVQTTTTIVVKHNVTITGICGMAVKGRLIVKGSMCILILKSLRVVVKLNKDAFEFRINSTGLRGSCCISGDGFMRGKRNSFVLNNNFVAEPIIYQHFQVYAACMIYFDHKSQEGKLRYP